MAHPPDELDRKIIVLFQRDGRLSYFEIARKPGLSEDVVRKRLKDSTEGIDVNLTPAISQDGGRRASAGGAGD